MVKIKAVWGRVFPPSNTFILLVALFLCVLLLVPNGQESRVQRFGTMHLAAVFCIGLYAMRFNPWVGSLLAYSVVFMAVTVSEMPIITVMLIMGILFVFVAGSKLNREYAYNIVCGIALVNVLWQVLQKFGILVINVPLKGYDITCVGLMANTNETAALLALCLPCFFRKKWVYAIPVMVIGLVLANSYGGILAAGIVSVIYGFIELQSWSLRISTVVVSLLIAAVFVFFIRPNIAPSFYTRLPAYSDTIKVFKANPSGWGIGQFKYVFPLATAFDNLSIDDAKTLIYYLYDKNALSEYIKNTPKEDRDKGRTVFTELHNEYLEWLFNAGWFGFILLAGVLLSVFRRGFKTRSLSTYGLLASCLSATWFFPWHIIPTAFLTVFYIGDIENGSTISAHTR